MAHEHKAQRVVGRLELLSEVFAVHSLAVRANIESEPVEVGDLVLALGDDDGHVGGFHQFDPAGQPWSFKFRQRIVLCARSSTRCSAHASRT
jgi:hypothetical protein